MQNLKSGNLKTMKMLLIPIAPNTLFGDFMKSLIVNQVTNKTTEIQITMISVNAEKVIKQPNVFVKEITQSQIRYSKLATETLE